jgi:hypothetical protein
MPPATAALLSSAFLQLVALLVRDLVAVACGHRRAPARSLVAALVGAAIARRAVGAAVVIKVSSAQVLIMAPVPRLLVRLLSRGEQWLTGRRVRDDDFAQPQSE